MNSGATHIAPVPFSLSRPASVAMSMAKVNSAMETL
jgi:hypothetical protein